MRETYTLFISALLIDPLLVISGRVIGCYYPFLLSRKHFLVIRSPKLREILIADGKNNSGSSRTRPEDRDKLSAVGAAYYLLLAVLLTGSLLLMACVLLQDLTPLRLAPRERLVKAVAALMLAAIVSEVVMFLISWLDYDLGKLMNGGQPPA